MPNLPETITNIYILGIVRILLSNAYMHIAVYAVKSCLDVRPWSIVFYSRIVSKVSRAIFNRTMKVAQGFKFSHQIAIESPPTGLPVPNTH